MSFQYPFYPHCGPGNRIDKKRPSDPIDAACWDHDNDPDFDYWRFTPADQRFIDALEHQPEFAAKVFAGFFKGKKMWQNILGNLISNEIVSGIGLTTGDQYRIRKDPPRRTHVYKGSEQKSSSRNTSTRKNFKDYANDVKRKSGRRQRRESRVVGSWKTKRSKRSNPAVLVKRAKKARSYYK